LFGRIWNCNLSINSDAKVDEPVLSANRSNVVYACFLHLNMGEKQELNLL